MRLNNKVRLMIIRNKTTIYLVLITLIGFYFRVFNINWDNNYYFHPDERAIVMFTVPISLPQTINDFFSLQSPLNPHFFAYGNMPIYLLKITSEIASLANHSLKEYGGMHLVGRPLSALFDTGTIIVIFALGSTIFSKRSGLISSFFYAACLLPIQLSHFYAVDTVLTFFTTLTIYFVFKFINIQSLRTAVFIGVFFGLSMATKVSAAIFVFPISVALILTTLKSNSKKAAKLILYPLIILLLTLLLFILTQPYILIDFHSFVDQTSLQSKMSKDAFLFPYTLQYFDKTPYAYELKNLFFWGIGPLISCLSFIGFISLFFKLKNKKNRNRALESFLLLVFLTYFVVFGSFAVGWMRYMLPIYPFLCIFAGYYVSEVIIKELLNKLTTNYFTKKILLLLFAIIITIYPASFLAIYTKPNTRIQASEWIEKNIPLGSVLAIEHWDDSLPVFGGNNYAYETLPLYDPETALKWEGINQSLQRSDYIIIASNRLYTPLIKMTNCSKLPENRCYKQTSEYYSKLFSGKLGFFKVAEFSEYPQIPFTNIKLKDDNADESFTVYDHPKVMIFKKNNSSNYQKD